MSAPEIVKFLTQNFPGETKRILSFKAEDWRKVLEVKYPYVAYASLRTPLLFVDSKVIDQCCPQRYCFSPKIVESLRRGLAEVSRGEPEAFHEWLERMDRAISEEARRDQDRYWRFVALACYCRDTGRCVSGLSYRGPAILICPERLEERVEEVMKMGAENPLFYVLRGVYSHEVTHSYIDAWSTDRSPSRAPLSRDKNADEFYHAVLEESMATAIEVGSISEWGGFLEKAYVAYLLKNLPAEYLGFHYIINRLRDLMLNKDLLGVLPEKYSFEGNAPPLWALSFRVFPSRLKAGDPEFLDWVLRCFFRRYPSKRELFYYLVRYPEDFIEDFIRLWRRVFGIHITPEILWKLAALSWLLGSPRKY